MPQTIIVTRLASCRCREPHKRGSSARIGSIVLPGKVIQSESVEFLDNDSRGWQTQVPNIPSLKETGPDPKLEGATWVRWFCDNRDENLSRLVRVIADWRNTPGEDKDSNERVTRRTLDVTDRRRFQDFHQVQVEIPNNFGCHHMVPNQHLNVAIMVPIDTFPGGTFIYAVRETDGDFTGTLPELDINIGPPAAPEPTMVGYKGWWVSVTNRHPTRARHLLAVLVQFEDVDGLVGIERQT